MSALLPFLLLFGLGFVGLYLIHVSQLSRQKEMKAFADRLEGGRLKGRMALIGGSDVSVKGHWGGRAVEARVFSVRSGDKSVSMIEFSVEAPNPLVGFTVAKAHLWNRMGRALGVVKDTPIGIERLDQKFILTGTAHPLRALFQQSPKLEWCLDDLFGAHGFSEVKVRAGKVSCQRRLPSPNARKFIEIVRSLCRVAALCERKEVRTKIKILGDRRALAWSYGGKGVRCPYCRDDVDLEGADASACPACRTIHHQECLNEAGGCTVLGCRESPRRVSV